MEMKEMNYSVSYNGGSFTASDGVTISNCFDWYTPHYIPAYNLYTYPFPILKDKGEQALNILRVLMDKDLIKKMDKVKDFVNLMDAIIKIL